MPTPNNEKEEELEKKLVGFTVCKAYNFMPTSEGIPAHFIS